MKKPECAQSARDNYRANYYDRGTRTGRGVHFGFCLLSICIWLSAALAQASEGRAPIIFAHGIGVPYLLYEQIVPVRKVFHELGYEVYIAHTPVTGTLSHRAQVLSREIERLVPVGNFHLVGHSMGGLDARLVVQNPRIGSRCLSVTMLATPNHGSIVADYVMAKIDDAGEESGMVRSILHLLGENVESVRDLTSQHMNEVFNPQVPDVPGIRYLSMSFYIPTPIAEHTLVPVIWLTHHILAAWGGHGREHAYNDGFVSLPSAAWGESLGVYKSDHWAETSQVPFIGGVGYKEVFGRVAEALDERFN